MSWVFCLALAAIEAWVGQQYFEPDSIAYLDMSDGLLRNDWHSLINLHWSPLYPFLIGVAARIAHPSPRWELPLAHLLNLAIFTGALAAFEFMMRQVIAILAPQGSGSQTKLPILQRAYVWELLGYSVFAWATFFLAGSVRKTMPDLCVAGFVYLDAGILLRILSRQRTAIWFVCLGVTLGLGYYAKTVLFPIGLLFMVVAVVAAGSLRISISSFPCDGPHVLRHHRAACNCSLEIGWPLGDRGGRTHGICVDRVRTALGVLPVANSRLPERSSQCGPSRNRILWTPKAGFENIASQSGCSSILSANERHLSTMVKSCIVCVRSSGNFSSWRPDPHHRS